MSQAKESYSDRLNTVISYSERLPFDMKKANDWAVIKRRADALDISLPDAPSPEYVKEVEDNYLMMSGKPMKHYHAAAKRAAMTKDTDLKSEGITKPELEIQNYFDVVSPLMDIIGGDRQRAKLHYVVSDSSLFTRNFYKKAQEDRLKEHIEKQIIAPMREMAFMEWSLQNGVQDIFQLDPEQRQQAQTQIDAMTEQMVAADVSRFVKRGRQSPLEIQGQALADALVQYTDFKSLTTEAYIHSYATDAAIFFNGVRRNRPYVRMVDALAFNTRGGNDRFIDRNPEFKEVEYLHPSEVWTRYGDQFSRADIKRFEELIQTEGSSPSPSQAEHNMALYIDFQGKEWLQETDLKTKEGQLRHASFMAAYGAMGNQYGEFQRIRVVHLTWLSLTRMKLITRGYNDGTVRDEWFTEDYMFNPENGDLEEKVEWVPQYFRATRIGPSGIGERAIFTDIGPVPYQRRDITDPYNVRSPYTGGYLNDLRGRGHRNPQLSRIKDWVHAFQVQMKTIQDREATDIGKIILMTVAAKPKGWSWGKLLEVVRATKMLPINTATAGLTPMDVQFFRDIDLSNLYDMLPRLNYLNFILSQIAQTIGVNAARQGVQAASTSVTNNMSNLERSYSQTHSRGVWIDEIAGRTIENMIYYGRMCAKNGNIFLRYALDDLSMAHIDIDVDDVESPLYGVKVMTDIDKLQELDVAKNLLHPYLQNQGMSYRYALKTLLAATKGELLDIADEAELELEIRNAKAAEAQSQQIQQEAAAKFEVEKAIAELKHNLDMIRDEQNNNAKRDMAALQAMTLANANDIDNDGNNDYIESAEKDRQVKTLEVLMKDQLERDKLALEQWSTKENLKAQLAKIEAMHAQAKARASSAKKTQKPKK